MFYGLTLIHVDMSNVRALAKKQVMNMSWAERYKVYLKLFHQEKHWKLIQEQCKKEDKDQMQTFTKGSTCSTAKMRIIISYIGLSNGNKQK